MTQTQERWHPASPDQTGPVLIRLKGVVASDPNPLGGDRTAFDFHPFALKGKNSWHPSGGKLRLFVQGHPVPSYGQELLVEGFLQESKGIVRVKPYHGFLPLDRTHATWPRRKLTLFRERAFHRVIERLPENEGALFGAMILGERSTLERELWALFARTGTIHLLAISGLHVGVIATLLYAACRLFCLGRTAAFFSILFGLTAYAFLVGGSPPVVRASLMIILYGLGKILFRKGPVLNILALAYLILLVWNPLFLFEAGFQLSFLSVLFIFLTLERLKTARLRQPVRFFAELLGVSAGVWIGIWPVVSYHFMQVSPVSLAANLFVVPLLFPIVGAGIPWLLLGSFPFFSDLLLGLEKLLLALLVNITQTMDRIPFGSFRLFAPGIFVFLYYVLLFLFFSEKFKRFRWKTVIATLFLLNFLVWIPLVRGMNRLTVTFLDVGHGDAIFVEFPDGRNLLVDGGDRYEDFDAGRDIVAPFLWRKNIRRLDAVLLTHTDRDHVGGLPFILKTFRPRTLFESGLQKGSIPYQEYREAQKKSGIEPVFLRRGQRIIGYRNVSLEVLHPPRPYLEGTGKDTNNNGVVLKLTHGKIRFLLTADIEKEAIRNIQMAGVDLDGEILKMPHHGGDLGEEGNPFLKAVSPEVAVISVGQREMFHLPSPKTLSLLADFNVPTVQTVRSGIIRIFSDGERFRVDTEREEGL